MNSKKPLVLILCGGRSLRLWPLSQYKSKNFLDVFGFSPLELTINRFLKLTPRENIFLVANISEKKTLEKLKSIKPANIFFEPESKNTAAAVLLSILHLTRHSKRNIIISPVDHLIKKEKKFYKTLARALAVAKEGLICTLGVKPTEAVSDFGYIQVKPKQKGIYPIRRFIEKPKPKRAKKLIAKGNCFYNSGIFISSIDTLIAEYKEYYPGYSHFVSLFKKKKTRLLYRKLKNIPFDKAIMEKTKKGALVRANFNWKDFGSWNTVYDILAKDKKGNAIRGSVSIEAGQSNLIYLDNTKKKVLALGLKDTFFIDSKDYCLIASRAHLNKLKSALKK